MSFYLINGNIFANKIVVLCRSVCMHEPTFISHHHKIGICGVKLRTSISECTTYLSTFYKFKLFGKKLNFEKIFGKPCEICTAADISLE